MPAEDIYNFEHIVPTAVKTVLEALDLRAVILTDSPVFQKQRPRVEVVYKHIGEHSPKRLAKLPDGTFRTSCFRGELKIVAITDADETGKATHSRYRSMVRHATAALESSINELHLPYHKIQFTVTGNEETGIREADGFQQTTFPYVIDISMQQDAWSQV